MKRRRRRAWPRSCIPERHQGAARLGKIDHDVHILSTMRRHVLPPPRGIPKSGALLDANRWPVHERPAGRTGHRRVAPALPDAEPLAEPSEARERRRWMFHPATGWFRRLERWTNHLLSRELYPRIPGLAWPYGRLLRRTLTLSEAEIPLVGLAPAFDGARLLLISDVHAGPFLQPRDLAQAFDRLCALEPDLILLGGDLTTARTDDLAEAQVAFRRLRAPLGVFAVLGNHDHYTGDVQRLQRMLADCGIDTLHNRCVPLQRNGQVLTLAGVDDLLMGRPDLSRALRGAEPPVILLSHNPDLFFEAVRAGVALMLSGHTHAGQIRVPGLPVLVRQSRYRLDEGRYRTAGTELVVSRGLGAVGLPWRVACPPEAVWLTLRCSGSAIE